MEVNAQLFVDAELDDHVVQEAAVDVVVQVLDGHFDLGRIADVIFVNLKQTSKSKSKLWTKLSYIHVTFNKNVNIGQKLWILITLLTYFRPPKLTSKSKSKLRTTIR